MLALHASNAINSLHSLSVDNPAQAQLRALVAAVRWDVGIDEKDFLGSVLEGERWLVHAAGAVCIQLILCVFHKLTTLLLKAEEPPTALLLAHAAFLSEKRNARRRSALWYLNAADRLDKAGNVSVIQSNKLRQS